MFAAESLIGDRNRIAADGFRALEIGNLGIDTSSSKLLESGTKNPFFNETKNQTKRKNQETKNKWLYRSITQMKYRKRRRGH